MKEIHLSYESGRLFKVNIVRYFRFKNNIYLIYTLNEKDERNYIKLYVVKVMKELGEFVTQTVRRQDEWNAMKGLVKRILGELKKSKLKTIIDLNYQEIDKVIIYENRSFLLASDLVELLAKDIMTPEQENNSTTESSIESVIQSPLTLEDSTEKTQEVENPISLETFETVQNVLNEEAISEKIEELELEKLDEEIEILDIDFEEIEELNIDEEFDDTEFLELEEKVEVLDI